MLSDDRSCCDWQGFCEPCESAAAAACGPAVCAADLAAEAVVECKAQLVAYLEAGCTPREQFALGTEQEMFVYRADDGAPAAYDDPQPGIRMLLEAFERFGWTPVLEHGWPIALDRDGATVTLEPGGQVELSGAKVATVHETCREGSRYHRELAELGSELGLRFLAIGHQPRHARAELPWMPKDRYRIMRQHMPTRGSLGLEMMQATCSTQVSVDFTSEADMVKKFRVALALQPVATALFACSPFSEGGPNGYLSYRRKIWSDTDPDRCGYLPFVFEEGMGFERYVDYILDVPMYFVRRAGEYMDVRGLSFRDFLAGRLPVLPGQRPTIRDWADHLTTVFPEVRLKRYLEMRGADAGGNLSRVSALTALWTGLLYDDDVLDAAWQRVSDWSAEERQGLAGDVARFGFGAPFRDATALDLCRWMVDLSRQGLLRRDRPNEFGSDEACYLAPLQHALDAGQTFAEQLLHRYHHEWAGDMDRGLRVLCEETFS